MKHLFLLLIITALASGCLQTGSTSTVNAEVMKVVDGDTLTIRFDNRSEEIRLKGIDTPEVNTDNKPYVFEGVSNTESGRNCLRRYGENASGYMKEKIGNSTVRLEYRQGLTGTKRGDYGRILGEIYYRNSSLNRELVRKGLARSYTEDGPYFEEEVEAKLEERGVWNCQRVS